ncbi:hypothetical protein ACVXHA_26765 [Escherichia coli]
MSPISSLTLWDSTSSQLTLSIMLVIVLIFYHCVALHSLELLQNVGTHDNRNSRRNENELY